MKKATESNFGRMHREIVRVVVVASRGCVYLPRYAAYRGYRAGRMHLVLNCYLGFHRDVGQQAEEAVGVAGGSLGFWLKMVSNYPYLLSRNVVEK